MTMRSSLALPALLALVSACGSEGDAPASTASADAGADADAAPPINGTPASCSDPVIEPKNAPSCITNDVAVFVDATSGLDTNPGTKEAPVKTLAAALDKLAGKPRVYVCEGTYAERVTLTQPVSLFERDHALLPAVLTLLAA